MRRWLILSLLCLLPSLAMADRWMRYTSGPFEVLTDAGERAGQETMVRFEEFRHSLGVIVGEEDLATPQPVRILVFKNAQGWTSPAPLTQCRDRYAIVLSEKGPTPPAVYGELARLLLSSNTNRMPAAFEHGLIEFFSTFQISGIHITVGAPPPQPDLDFARIHLLVAAPEYFGKLRVLLYNLRKGVDDDPAYHNAFGKSAAEVEAQARRHFAARQFPTTTISSRLWRPTTSTRSPSPMPMCVWRAPIFWPARNRPSSIKACSAITSRFPNRKKASACWLCAIITIPRPARISRPPWKPAPRARDASSNTRAWSPIMKRPGRLCCAPPASTPSSTNRSPCWRRATPIRASD